MSLQVRIKKKLSNFVLDVDFEVNDEIFALLGASGCGKSMTLKCIAGIESPDEGFIILNGRVLFDSKKKINLPPQKRKVGYLFQDYALFPNMTVLQNIMAGMGKRPQLSLAEEYLKKFHLEELKNQYPSKISGGQKQRVAMARMLAAAPEVILLDEPFSALDSHLKWNIEQQMRELLTQVNKPTLFVSHDRDEVYRNCTMISCINQGRMEVVESVKEFFQNPKTKTAAALSGCKNISDIKVEKISETYIQLQALDWKHSLRLDRAKNPVEYEKIISGEIEAIGIRAHYLKPVYEDKETDIKENILKVCQQQVIEDSFEWTVMFKVNSDGGWIQWKTPKQQNDNLNLPCCFQIDQQDIIFLKK